MKELMQLVKDRWALYVYVDVCTSTSPLYFWGVSHTEDINHNAVVISCYTNKLENMGNFALTPIVYHQMMEDIPKMAMKVKDIMVKPTPQRLRMGYFALGHTIYNNSLQYDCDIYKIGTFINYWN